MKSGEIKEVGRWAGHDKLYGREITACNILVGRPLGKGPFGKPRTRWDNNIKKTFKEMRCVRMAKDHVQGRTLILAMLIFRGLLLDRLVYYFRITYRFAFLSH